MLISKFYGEWNKVKIYYSDTYERNSDGTVSLTNVEYVEIYYANNAYKTLLTALNGKYVFPAGNSSSSNQYLNRQYFYKCVDDVASSAQGTVDSDGCWSITIQGVFCQWGNYCNLGEWEELSSNNELAYPQKGVIDGYEYNYWGKSIENCKYPTKVIHGEYTGTSTYGATSPTSLTFEIEPKLIIIQQKDQEFYKTVLIKGCTKAITYQNSNMCYIINVIWNGSTVSWYSTENGSYQLNNANS